MTTDFAGLDELEQDAITEIANLGVGRAANSLRQMLGEQVLISVPVVRVTISVWMFAEMSEHK